jgi:hypothetical protein
LSFSAIFRFTNPDKRGFDCIYVRMLVRTSTRTGSRNPMVITSYQKRGVILTRYSGTQFPATLFPGEPLQRTEGQKKRWMSRDAVATVTSNSHLLASFSTTNHRFAVNDVAGNMARVCCSSAVGNIESFFLLTPGALSPPESNSQPCRLTFVLFRVHTSISRTLVMCTNPTSFVPYYSLSSCVLA